MNLEQFLKAINGKESDIKEYNGAEAMAAVERNGNALLYVRNQTEAICLKAVEKDNDALQFVDKSIFDCFKRKRVLI
jgi:hypothetical protein